ncbi:MAG: hypothetical protein AAB263_16180 [Planctomycetota bacterium]
MATAADADLILKLYDLRRECVCRQARSWFAKWTPTSAEEVSAVSTDGSRQDNAWLRQATSYWEMAFSLANCGAIDATLFAKNCGEGLFFNAKCQYLKKKFPDAWNRSMAEVDAFTAKNEIAQKKAEMMKGRFPAV